MYKFCIRVILQVDMNAIKKLTFWPIQWYSQLKILIWDMKWAIRFDEQYIQI